jgi:hypothetical protein
MSPLTSRLHRRIASTLAMELIGLIASLVKYKSRSNALASLLFLNKHWHNSIVNTPLLFNKVDIAPEMTHCAVSQLLALSQQLPLSIALDYSDISTIANSNTISHSSLLASEANRISIFRLSCENQQTATTLFRAFVDVQWPILNLVAIYTPRRTLWTTWDLDVLFQWLRISSSTLDALNIQGGLANDGNTLALSLTEFSRLRKFTYRGPQYSRDWDTFCNVPALRTLKFLSLEHRFLCPIIDLISSHTHPSLTKLIIHSEVFSMSPDIDGNPPWIRLSRACPRITDLRLPTPYETLLVLLAHDHSIWPFLTDLAFFRGPPELDLLYNLVLCRFNTPLQLRQLGIVGDWEVEELRALRLLVDVQMRNIKQLQT